jgi:hypothetical protein
LVSAMLKLLSPDGVLLIGNFRPNECAVFMEHLIDWRLIYREESDLHRLAARAVELSGRPATVRVLAEPNNRNLFLELRLAQC